MIAADETIIDDICKDLFKIEQDKILVNALCTWRYTKGIYQFDLEVEEFIYLESKAYDSTLSMPSSLLKQIPEWCIYIKISNELVLVDNVPVDGFFAWIDNPKSNQLDLRVILLCNGKAFPHHMVLGDWSIKEGIKKAFHQVMESYGWEYSKVEKKEVEEILKNEIELMKIVIQYLLILNQPDAYSQITQSPKYIHTKQGYKYVAQDKPIFWEIGIRMGNAIRLSKQQYADAINVKNSSFKRPHIRKAHWHGYWTGKLNEPENRKFQLQWIPPTFINATIGDELPTTIKKVKK